MEEIHHIIEALQASNREGVLATIIHVEGSAYRKEGTAMLFQDNGAQTGTLSGGCLEADLALRAEQLMKGGCRQTFVFDMRDEDDLSWGQGSGCNGQIVVLLEPVDSQRRADLLALKSCLDQRKQVWFFHKLTDNFQAGDYLYVPVGGQAFGSWNGDIPRGLLQTLLHEGKTRRMSGIQRLGADEGPVYIHLYHPQPRLIIFGAGADAKPLVSFANRAGFTVVLADWRAALCNKNHFPEADQFILGFPKEIVRSLSFTQDDYIVLMTHQFQRDQEILRLLQGKNLRYIGVLGSANRMERLLGKKERPASIRSPAGLPIGAEGPEEIAISILAELIGALRNGSHPAEFPSKNDF